MLNLFGSMELTMTNVLCQKIFVEHIVLIVVCSYCAETGIRSRNMKNSYMENQLTSDWDVEYVLTFILKTFLYGITTFHQQITQIALVWIHLVRQLYKGLF